MSDFSNIKPGDEVVVQSRNTRAVTVEVTRVGRKYFYTGKEYTERRYEISSGQGEHGWYATTPAEYRDQRRKDRMEKILRDRGIELRFSARNQLVTIYNALKICFELPDVEG